MQEAAAAGGQAARRPTLRGEADRRHVVARPAAHRPAAAARDRRLHLLHDAPGPGHQQPGAVLRQEPRPHVPRQQDRRDVRGRRRRRRGQDGAPGSRGVPQVPREVQLPRRAHPARRAPGRPSGHRQDAAWRGPSPARPACRSSASPGSEFVEMFVGVGASRVRDLFDQAKRNTPVHRLRRRDRRGRPPARRRPRRLARRARADPEPDPRRDGRLRHEHQRDRRRRHEPPRRPRPGAPAPGPLRPPGHPRPART